jgi:hypothetical protein
LAGYIKTIGANDTYPTHLDSLGSGGYRTVATKAGLNAITSQRRVIGMTAYVVATDSTYQLRGGILNANWVAVAPGIVTGVLPFGLQGQQLKVQKDGSNKYTASDPLVYGQFVYTDDQLTRALSKGKATQLQIFNSFKRYSHSITPVDPSIGVNSNNIPGNPSQTNSWAYDTVALRVNSTFNTGSKIGFFSNDRFDRYIHQATLGSDAGDNDYIGLVIAFVEDPNDMVQNWAYGLNPADFNWPINVTDPLIPNQHSLTVYRARNNLTSKEYFIAYDLGKLTEKIITDNTNMSGLYKTTTSWPGQTVDLKVTRLGDSILVQTSQYSDAPGGKGTIGFDVFVDLNSDPVLSKFKGKQPYGYAALSQANAYFSNVSFSGSNNVIYDLRQGDAYAFTNSGYVLDTARNLYDGLGVRYFWRNQAEHTYGYVKPDKTIDILSDTSVNSTPYKLKSDSISNGGYVTHGYFDANQPTYTGSNGIIKSGHDFRQGGEFNNINLSGNNAAYSLQIERHDFGNYATDFSLSGGQGNLLWYDNAVGDRFGQRMTMGDVNTNTYYVGWGNNTLGYKELWFKRNGMFVMDTKDYSGLKQGGRYEGNYTEDNYTSKRYVDSTTKSKADTGTVYVFLNIGQSNIQGHGDSSLSPKIITGTSMSVYSGQIKPANDPVGNAVTGSMWPAFAIRYYELTHRKTAVVSASVGGSSMLPPADIGNGNWSTSGTLRFLAKAKLDSALTILEAAGYKPIIAGVNMSQGEQDATAILNGLETQADYKAGLIDLISYFRTSYSDNKLPYYIFRTGKKVNGNETMRFVRVPQEEVAVADYYTKVVYRGAYDFGQKGWLQVDNLHYTQAGYNDMGYTGAENVVQVEKNRATYTMFDKTGFGVNTPLAYGHFKGTNDTIPSIIIDKGKGLPTTAKEGAISRDATKWYVTDSTLTVKQLVKMPNVGIPVARIPFIDSSSDLASDSLFNYNTTSSRLGVGSAAANSPLDSRIFIKGKTSSSGSYFLSMYDSGLTRRYSFDNAGFFSIGSGAMSVNSTAAGTATFLVRGGASNTGNAGMFTSSIGDTIAQITNSGRIIMNKSAIRVARLAADPTGAAANGDIAYNTTSNTFRFFQNGSFLTYARPDSTIVTLATVSQLSSYQGRATVAIVTDTLRGGQFKLQTGSITVDNGLSFTSAISGKYWLRQMVNNNVLVEWYGANNSASMQAAIVSDTVNYSGKYIITSKSSKINVTSTINISKGVTVDMPNTYLAADSTFAKRDTMVRVFGYAPSKDVASTSQLTLKIDGGTRKPIGIVYRARLLGSNQDFYFANCANGIIVTGNSEKQNFKIGGISCDTLVYSKDEGTVSSPHLLSPDENRYNISGGWCTSYYVQAPSSQISEYVFFNVENSPVNTGAYAVDVRGAKLIKLAGEIRGIQGLGSVFIAGTSTLNVVFDNLNVVQNKTGTPVIVNSCNTLNGSVYATANNATAPYGVYIGGVVGGGTLNITSDAGVIPIVIGDDINARRTRRMIINATTVSTSGTIGMLCDNLENVIVNYGSILPFTMNGRVAWSQINIPASFIQSNVAINNTTSTYASNINLLGAATIAQVAAYSTPILGMRLNRVSDNNAGAFYNGTAWVYENDNALVNKPNTYTQPNTFAAVFTQAIQPVINITYDIGTVSASYVNAFIRTLTSNTTLRLGTSGDNAIIFNQGTGPIVEVARFFATTHNFIVGSATDNGYKTEIGVSGTAGYFKAGGFSVNSSGNVIVPTQSVTDNSTNAANTANVMSHFLTASATLDFASTAAQTSSELTITVTGAADGDVVSVGVPNVSSNANSCFTARVSATNTVTIKFNNYSSGAIDPTSGTFKVTVLK